MPSFNAISRRYRLEIVLSQLNSASEAVNWIIVDILKYLTLSLSISFLLEMAITKDH